MSDRERHIGYDLTYMWNLRTSKTNKEHPKLMQKKETRLMYQRQRKDKIGGRRTKGTHF